MKIGDIVERNGKKFKVTDVVQYDFGLCPNLEEIEDGIPTQAVVSEPKEIDYQSMNIKRLQAMCRERGLDITGTKTDVIRRLKGV